jgi:hypothetical protein
MEQNSRGNKIVTMTTVVAQSPSVTGFKELTTNQIKSNQIHPSPTKQQQQQQLRVRKNWNKTKGHLEEQQKMVVLGFSALDALCAWEQTWVHWFCTTGVHCKPWFRTDPRSSSGYHPNNPKGECAP